jgi:hypothetical protein
MIFLDLKSSAGGEDFRLCGRRDLFDLVGVLDRVGCKA